MRDLSDEVIDVLERLPGADDVERTDVTVILAALVGVIQAKRVQRRAHDEKWGVAKHGTWVWCDETNVGTDSEYHAELKVYPGIVQILFRRGGSARYILTAKDVASARALCEARALEAREVE